jgi:hypothetical protein
MRNINISSYFSKKVSPIGPAHGLPKDLYSSLAQTPIISILLTKIVSSLVYNVLLWHVQSKTFSYVFT